MTEPIQSAIDSIHAAGYTVNNLFELSAGRWQANITDGEAYYEFGIANSPEGALRAALLGRGNGVPAYRRPEPKKVDLLSAITDSENNSK